MLLFLVCLVCVASAADALRFLKNDFTVGLIDPSTGAVSCTTNVQMPPTTCTWSLGDGTRGQTSAVFYTNQTWFFLAQENCQGSIGKTYVMLAMGPFCWPNREIKNSKATKADPVKGMTFRSGPMSQITTSAPINALNMAWDHTCNVVVLAPSLSNNATVIETRQCSEFDGQVRGRPPYAILPGSVCQNCWRKVPGPAALDQGRGQSIWNPELNCGDSCVMYTIEERLYGGQPQKPRAVIGRTFRRGELVSNFTDSLQVQTLAYNPWSSKLSQFIGIGLCCTESWCHQSCQGLDQHLVLFSMTPVGNFQIIGDIGTNMDQVTVKLGVEFSSMWSTQRPRMLYVANGGSIWSFACQVSESGLITSTTLVTNVQVDGLKQFSMWISGPASR